jgi:hypothetical protein
LPVGEELSYLLEPTTPPPWAAATTTPQLWQEQQGDTVRLVIEAWRDQQGMWTLSAVIRLVNLHWWGEVPQDAVRSFR